MSETDPSHANPFKGLRRVKRYASYHGLRKRCDHPRKQWSECDCPWHFYVTHQKVRHRGVLGRFANRGAAQEAFDAAVKRIEAGQPAVEPPAPRLPAAVYTVATYAEVWLPAVALTRKKSTVGFYGLNLKRHVVPALGPLALTALTRSDCKRFTLSLREKKLSRSSMAGIVTTLSAMMSAAVDDEIVAVNPARRLVKLLRDPNASKSRRLSKDKYFERDDAATLLDVARDGWAEWYPFFLCGLRTGMRMSELLALQWGDIDWRRGFIHVQRGWVRQEWTTPKNGEGREVDMSSQLRAELRLWRRKQSIEWMRRGMGRPDLVFPSNARTPHDASKVAKVFDAIQQKAELRHRNLHAMRHTFISLLLQSGASPAYVQKQAGHKSMDLTINVYGHFVPGGNRAIVDVLDAPARKDTSETQGMKKSA